MQVEEFTLSIEKEKDGSKKLNRRQFLLKTLFDATYELSSLNDTQQIIENALLILMGTLGLTEGFILLINTKTQNGQIAGRGLKDNEIKTIYEKTPQLIQQYFPDTSETTSPLFIKIHSISGNGAMDGPYFPQEISLLIQWSVNKEYSGLMGLGSKILKENYGDEDIEFLSHLISTLVISIKNARSMEIVRKLYLNLHQKTIEQEDALKQVKSTQNEVDRQVFHLKALYDITSELSGLNDTNKILETFLLLAMGTLSIKNGYILLVDKEDKRAQLVYRGIEGKRLQRLQEDDSEEIINRFFKAAESRGLTPMNTQLITDKNPYDKILFHMDAKVGVFFAIDEVHLGLIAFNDKLTSIDYSQQEQKLLVTLTNNFMVLLKNARSFEVIQQLNLDLEKRNIQLKKTVDELTSSRRRIEILEKTRAHVKSSIQKEIGRAQRVSAVDFIFIFTLAVILSLIFNFSNPNGINLKPSIWSHEPSPSIDLYRAKIKHDSGKALFVDARPPNFFKQRHIQGAINLPLTLFDFVYMMKLNSLDPEKEIIVYGRNFSRFYDEEVAFKLISRGHTNVNVLLAGLSTWEKNNNPIKQ